MTNNTILAGNYILDEFKKINAFDKLEKIGNGFKSSKKIDFLWEIMFIYTVTLMDMYTLGRMTRPDNNNIIVLAGMNHIERYKDFFIKQGFKSEWNAKQYYKKCSQVPLSLFHKEVAGRYKKKKTKRKIR